MFGSEILDVAIGLILIYLLLSLAATAVREAAEAVFQTRGLFLERGIRELLGAAKEDNRFVEAFYNHPTVSALFGGKYVGKSGSRWHGRGLPSYIPAGNFASTVLDLAVRGTEAHQYAVERRTSSTVAELREAATHLPNAFLQRAVLVAIDEARGDMDRVRANLEKWFDSAMDRVSGGYKRRTHLWLLGTGLGLAIAMNVNTITLAEHLAHNKAAREAMVKRAEALSADAGYRKKIQNSDSLRADLRRQQAELTELGLPIGLNKWPDLPAGATGRTITAFWMRQVIGILLTALAVTLGAPFWFDALNKMMVIRSTVKPREKSQDEGSEDRQPRPATPRRAEEPARAPVQQPETVGAYAPPGASPPAAPEHEPRQWAAGNPDEGVL